MKPDAFDDLRGSFNYKEQLEEARRALNSKVREFVASTRALGYKELASFFGIATGTLYAIMEGQKAKEPPGPRGKRRRYVYVPEDRTRGHQGSSLHAGATEVERNVHTLLRCVEVGETTRSGDVAYESVMKWLKARQTKKKKLDRERAERLSTSYRDLRTAERRRGY
jgi:hypothetical protein